MRAHGVPACVVPISWLTTVSSDEQAAHHGLMPQSLPLKFGELLPQDASK
jgi:hypothetical protein